VKRRAKDAVKFLLDATRLRPLGQQFWGYARNCNEYRFAMNAARFANVEDGFIGPLTDGIYWISGSLSRRSQTV
jgi:hypothetical protein